jgi:outer membrane lipoprotein SlyB
MKPVVGIFKSRFDAFRAVDGVRALGVTQEKINILTPGSTDREVAAVAVSETEQPGMGAAIGTLVGGSVGAAGGFGAGAALASLLVPGVGPILAGGLLGMSLLGLGGAATGAAAGDAIEDTISGIPRDELYVYEDALRKGRTVVIAEADDEPHAEAVRQALEDAGAETIDAAREQWWIGLRTAEQETYADGNFEQDEPYYRKGFEAAQSPAVRGKSFDDALDYLTRHNQIAASHPAFKRGYERGRQFYEKLRTTA